MNFFFDNNLPPKLARGLQQLFPEDVVVHLRDKFDASTPDTEWITQLANESTRWCVITQDKFLKNDLEKTAAKEAAKSGKLSFVFLHKSWSNNKFNLKCAALILWWEAIRGCAAIDGGVYNIPWKAGFSPERRPRSFTI